jgi:hypothetical protein
MIRIKKQEMALKHLDDCGWKVHPDYLHSHIKQAMSVVNSIYLKDGSDEFYPKDKIMTCLKSALKYKTYKNMERYISECKWYIAHIFDTIPPELVPYEKD